MDATNLGLSASDFACLFCDSDGDDGGRDSLLKSAWARRDQERGGWLLEVLMPRRACEIQEGVKTK
jgi:hypothetical protein